MNMLTRDTSDILDLRPRPDGPRPVLVRFSRGIGWEAAAVRWFTWSDYAHVGFLLPENTILDATPQYGVSLRPWHRATDDDSATCYCAISAPKAQIDAAIYWAASQVGKPYDWTAIYGFLAHRDWHRDTSWFCSEFVIQATLIGGCPLLSYQKRQVDRITPCDIRLSPILTPVLLDINTGR